MTSSVLLRAFPFAYISHISNSLNMQRRSFVKSVLVSSAVATSVPAKVFANAAAKNDSEYYELRTYILKDFAQQKMVEDYLSGAAIPALNRAGVKHVGVFTEMTPAGQTKIFAIIQYDSSAHFNVISEILNKDTDYKARASAYLNATAKEPAYERIESSFLKSFTAALKLSVPENKERIFELRQYQSASEATGKKKIEMFTHQGEIDIFKRLGFKPVFWGETVIGTLMPNLTYMVCFDNMAAKQEHWKSFGGDPQWKKISSVAEYADALLVSKITSTMLIPTVYSQM